MANASGPAAQGFLPADFVHGASGVHYRVFEDDGKVWLSYERDSATRKLDGRKQLLYFIGSGERGRTYLFESEGYWFESPINWYAKKRVWDMAPAFQAARQAPLALPVDPGCLHCHTSGARPSLPEARNRYADAPFAATGITCESCHGNAEMHLASGGEIPMLKLSTLEPVRRDSICLNCHLEGQISVNREGKRPEDFQPGDNLFAYAAYFVVRGENGSGGRATSQWEALLQSACKQKSGDRLTCTTCHDPHGDPAPEQRVEYYREKCLQCHNQPAIAQHHHPENRDCTSCHMARLPSNDIAHEQVTDHWIRKRVSNAPVPEPAGGLLEGIGSETVEDRDVGLAYGQRAEAGDEAAGRRALELLRKAEREGKADRDHDLHALLGFLEQVNGDSGKAAAEYRLALSEDPYDATAAGNLALIEAEEHQYDAAAHMWRDVLRNNPAESGAGINLAVIECGGGEPGLALETLDRVLEFAPDLDRARMMAEQIRSGKRLCKTR